jgi:hypothetical protein
MFARHEKGVNAVLWCSARNLSVKHGAFGPSVMMRLQPS